MQTKSKKITLFSATMLAISSLIGSGWLFGASEAAATAGPAAIISWIVGAIIMGLIAANYVELGVMLPESGGMSRYAQYSHGPLLGFIAAWANWVSLVAIIPIEAVAAVQYMSSWPWKWANWTNNFMVNGHISTKGLWVVFLFMLIFTLLNFWSVELMTKFTNFISIFKLGMPLLTIVLLICSSFHPANFGNSIHTFMPNGTSAIFEATTISGIIFSYNAFQTIINIGGEITNPQKNIFRGIIISLTIAAVIYILLQVAFIGAIEPGTLAKDGWQGLNFNSPFADLAIMVGMYWLAVLLYLDAFVSPFGTGVSFVATSGRTLAAMTLNRHIPKWLGKTDGIYGNPRLAYVTNLVIGSLLVTIFRDWSVLASVISTATLIAYLTGPVTAVSMRQLRPHYRRPVKSKLLPVIAPLAFILASLAIYWAMWPTTVEVIGVIIIGLPIYIYYDYKNGRTTIKQQLKSSSWMIVYLIFISIMSYIGSAGFKGQNYLPYPWDFVVIIMVSYLFYRWGINSKMLNSPDLPMADKINAKVKIDE
nr:APC family permease [Limosilactobacillus agrestis]